MLLMLQLLFLFPFVIALAISVKSLLFLYCIDRGQGEYFLVMEHFPHHLDLRPDLNATTRYFGVLFVFIPSWLFSPYIY